MKQGPRSGVGAAGTPLSTYSIPRMVCAGLLYAAVLCTSCGPIRMVADAAAVGRADTRLAPFQSTVEYGTANGAPLGHRGAVDAVAAATEGVFRDVRGATVADSAQTASDDGVVSGGAVDRSAWYYLNLQTGMGPRNPGSPGHRELTNFLVSELAECADQVRVQPFEIVYEGAKYSMANVSALFKSSHGSTRPFVLLGAHFDTRPRADRDPIPARRSTPIIGANDGASGVAVLLEVARALERTRPPLPVMLAFFDGEDFGPSADWMFLGSKRFAEELCPADVVCMILLDMVGDAHLDIYVEGHSRLSSPGLVEAVWSAAESLGYGHVFHPEVRYHVLDDHVPFMDKGIPAIDVIDFDYPYWHTTSDTPDKCSPESLRIVRDVILEVILRNDSKNIIDHEPEAF